MRSSAPTPDEYYQEIPDERKGILSQMRKVLKDNLPEGFSEAMGYGLPGFCVPHSLYPAGYHCDPRQPLPFIGLASQKNFIALYHMGLYADPILLKWFQDEWPQYSKKKLDMGKSCIRFKKPDDVPLELLAKLARKMTVSEWIALYESGLKR